MEALLRWHRPGVRLIEPNEFVGIAEETGMIHSIGEWMLRRAAHDCPLWQEARLGVSVSVNVSPRQFDNGALVAIVRGTCSASRELAPERLTLEITETVLLDHGERTVAMLDELHDPGHSDLARRLPERDTAR